MSDFYTTLPKKLPFHERFAACMLALTFLAFALLTLKDGDALPKTRPPIKVYDSLIEVTIKGAVKHPGVYKVKKGTPVREILEQAEPLSGAKLKGINQENTIKQRRTITIRP